MFFGTAIFATGLAVMALVVLAIILAILGKSFGLRKFYVSVLLKVFNFGMEKSNSYAALQPPPDDSSSDSDDESATAPVSSKSSFNTNGDSRASLIARQTKTHTSGVIPNIRSLATMEHEFQLDDAMYFCKSGIEAIVEDDVTQRFLSSELPSWNLLTRTNENYQHISNRLTVLWFLGGLFRYICLLPVRLWIVSIGLILLVITTAIVGYIPSKRMRYVANRYFTMMSCRVITRAFGAVIRFHNTENRAKPGGICVANHTSPIDVIILQNDNSYALIGQRHGGFMGMVQNALSRAADHIWFERSVSRDRISVANRLRAHVHDTTKQPILIFPEGTCINNTSVMMFKKGSFDVGGVIYPVAVKYDSRFADCFWNSSKYNMLEHIGMLLTSWAIVADVWYLPPVTQQEGESSIAFANRVKSEIARQGGLVDLEWDGGLKREKPKASLKQLQQRMFFNKQLTTD
ncbi:glycerol-3-phosphate acyltransferase 3-like [Watersipora subatra]|uniref:glycerol-3-phosphate acyltransferase 3-like n=1 Tax=Watersipora subatra TaxID=2589382 RepID=UPI00355ACFBA